MLQVPVNAQTNTIEHRFFQVVAVAAVMTLLFKTDKDVAEFESNLGKLKEADDEILPLNTSTPLCFFFFISKS